MGELFGGLAILYMLFCLIPAAVAIVVGSPFPHALFVWILFTAWHPAGWVTAAAFIFLTRRAAH